MSHDVKQQKNAAERYNPTKKETRPTPLSRMQDINN